MNKVDKVPPTMLFARSIFIWRLYSLFCIKGTFLSKDTDVFVITDEHFIFLNLKIWILWTENCLEIEDFLKFESLEIFKGKKAAFGWLRQP